VILREDGMDGTTLIARHDEPAAPVRWEPCAELRPDESGPACTACGWPLEDHTAAALAARRAA
jgi:hypothetical protein